MLTLIKITVGLDMEEVSTNLPSGTFIILNDTDIIMKEEDYTDFYEVMSIYQMTVIYRQPV